MHPTRSLLLAVLLAGCTTMEVSSEDGGTTDDPDADPGAPDAEETCEPRTWYADCDEDGIAAVGGETTIACDEPAPPACGGGWVEEVPVQGADDCNEQRADVHPGAAEPCDGADNDCDGQTDENGASPFYRDEDGDGHGNATMSMVTCNPPAGYVASSDDCNDACGTCYPGAGETCDLQDNDCDAVVDDGVLNTYYRDQDVDGHGVSTTTTTACTAPGGYVASSDDCNDSCVTCYPGAGEICDSLDNDCDAAIDDGVTFTYYRDADGDGYGNASVTTQACSTPAGYVATATDCNDGSGSVNPGHAEVCFNAVDDNCSATQDEAPECSISCSWSGARWLSHGWDGGNASATGAWATCQAGRLSYVLWVNGAGTGVNPLPAGTADPIVNCGWGNANRWAAQGWDGANGFIYGVDATCSGGRVTNLNWGSDALMPGQVPLVTNGQQHGCNWNGAVFFTHGWDGGCAFATGMNVTCSNNHITDVTFVEGPGCSRARD